MAVTATFDPATGVLAELGDALDNSITTSRNAAGTILVNGGAVAVAGGTPTVANTALIQVFAQGGNDTVTLDETNGALPAAQLFGGTGNDTLTGGAGGDQLFGQDDNDTLLGKGGFDFLFGGAGNDTLTGGDADDQVFGEAGNDRMIWNPGDDTDLFEGGDGVDTAEVNGGNGAEVFTATANGARVRFDRLNPAPFALDIGTTENLVVNMNGGDDSFSATGNLAALISITVDGGAGNDTILGSNGADLLLGGDGNDFIDGQQGNDTVFLGAGDDVFQWDPGDGSDIVEGQDGTDTMLFNGSNGAEIFEVSANGGRVLFTRNLGSIVMDLNDIEIITLNALGNTDTVTINDLTGTDVTAVNVNLASTIGGVTGDGQADTVIANGTNGDDTIDIFGAGTSVAVIGLAAQVALSNTEGANDTLVINALGGDDTITATTLPAGVIKLVLDGGAGNDTILGSQGADTILGGDGNDFVFGDNGNDVAFLGAGDDVFQWDPGDGNDTVEGQDGTDKLLFFGSNASENIDIFANGGRVTFFRNVANVTMDLDDVEHIDFRALGGADNIVIGDLSGTDITQINLDLRGPVGGGDGAADTVTVNATNGDDVFGVTGDAGGVTVFGLQAGVNILFPEAANDRLVLNGLGGDDVINATSLDADGIKLTINGGLGADIMIGSEGDDLFNGGDGNDIALMGSGDDTFVWNPGDDNDTLEGQSGSDTMQFNGANVAENIDISANGGRVIFFRNIANVTMDLNDVETIAFNALGGADNITINDLSGTDVTTVDVNLASTIGGSSGDGQPDTIIINGTNGNDTISLSLDATGRLVVDGLTAQIVIANFDAGDTIRIMGLGGDDAIDASALGAIAATLNLDGGDGNDVLLGGAGADVLSGGAGDDVLIGNASADVLDGGTGNNILLQDGSPATGNVVKLFGNDTPNNLTVSRNAAGQILANGGAIPLPGTPTIANTAVIEVFGKSGNDVLTLDESNGALPRADLFGGADNDTLTGGSGGDHLFGEAGNDTLLGKGGFDLLFGGDGNDILTGGDADDQVFGGAGNDRMIWNPGDDTDLFEGGDGVDSAEVNGGNGAEVFTATANGARVRFDRLDPAPFSLDIGTTERLVVNMNGGDDSFSATGNLAALIKLTVDGGAGNDTILGSNGSDLLYGGVGNDFIDGQQGNDTVFLGDGDDVFQWDPGDGSDIVEGQAGTDTMLFNGSAGAEIFNIAANGARVRLTRNLGNIVMNLNDIETITLNALGNTDTVTINDLTGTDVTAVNVNFAGTIGGTTGDGQADVAIVNGTNSNNTIDIFGAGTSVAVIGLAAQVALSNTEGANDTLVINALGGDDTITATTLPAGVIKLVLDGGAGNDTILGSQGADTILGGDGNDFVFGDNGNDVAFLGAGDDVFQWDPGDGNDTVEGQDGTDKLLFFGSNASENIDIFANGGRVTFFRNVANVTMDLDDVEHIDFRALGGADNIVIGDLSGTDITQINLDLRGPVGGGDGAADTVTVNATNGDDVFGVTGDAGGVTVFGLQAGVNILFPEAANDRLVLNGLGGDDVINATSLDADGIKLTINGGLGADIMIGSEGDDLFNGGDGNDIALMGSGDDTFVWNPGDDNDTLEGQSGSDTMQFNGANVAENIDISANGGRVIFFRNIANVTMDLNDVETIAFNALGGADNITINDLSGTDVTTVDVNLASTIGGSSGDGQVDTVIINATNGDDVVIVTGSGGSVSVLGLSAQVNISNFEAIDRIIINALSGDDVIEGSGLPAGVSLTANGGNGDDVIIGGAGDDILSGNDGDDVLLGGGGLDILDGGPGDNVVIQSLVIQPDFLI